MKYFIPFLLITWVFFISCQNDTMDDATELSVSNELAKQSLKTYLGEYTCDQPVRNMAKSYMANTVTRTLKIHRSMGTFHTVYPSDECGPYAQVVIEGSGNATFLGNFNVTNTYCFDGSAPTSLIEGVLTAANGDQIFTYVDYAEEYEPPQESYFHYVVYDGTGRFEGVTGYVEMYGIIDRGDLTFDLYGIGELTY